MKLRLSHVRLCSFLIVSTLSQFASAKTFIVHLRSPETYKAIAEDLKDAVRRGPVSDAFGRRRLELPKTMGTKARTLKGLEHLNVLLIEGSDEDARQIAAAADVSSIEADFMLPRPAPVSDADMAGGRQVMAPVGGGRPNRLGTSERPWGIDFVHAPSAWSLGAQGQAVRVLVLDTGLDKDHLDLRERLEEGKNFVTNSPFDIIRTSPTTASTIFSDFLAPGGGGGGDFNGPDNPEAPYEFFDAEGHGTHVSGTIAATMNEQGVVGVAPLARILMGRVCGKRGCPGSAIVNGLNWALSKNVDLVSMSLGGAFQSSSQAEAIKELENRGIVVVAASGNSGEARVSYPAALETVIAVGAVNSTGQRADFSQYGPELDITAPGVDVLSSVPTGTGRGSEVQVTLNGALSPVNSTGFLGTQTSTQPVQNEVVLAGLGRPEEFPAATSGKFVLIQRGELTFADKVKNAIAAGAAGVVIYNNTTGLASGSLSENGTLLPIPVVMIEQGPGEALANELRSGAGGRASIMVTATDYASFSGTSMATPHTAGIVALIKSMNRSLAPAQIREIIRSTAIQVNGATLNEYGAGLIDAEAAVRAAKRF